MSETKYEFASPEWLTAMEAALSSALEQAPADEAKVRFSYSERYTDPPEHLAKPEGVGYTARFEDGTLTFLHKPTEDVDVAITADYTAILPRVRWIIGDDPAAFGAGRQPLVDQGKLKHQGDTPFPAFLLGGHDIIAAQTR